MYTAAFLKHPRTPTGVTRMDYQSADSEHVMKRIRSGQSDEVWMNKTVFQAQFLCFLTLLSTAWPSCRNIIFIVLFVFAYEKYMLTSVLYRCPFLV